MREIALSLLLMFGIFPSWACEPPEVNAEGLCVYEQIEPTYEMYFTESELVAMAQMLYGEARGCSLENQQKAVWCVLNRVDDERFPNSIIGVLSQAGQFHGYSSSFPVLDELAEVAEDVMIRWSMEKQGAEVERELPASYLYFSGNGTENTFREGYA